MLSTTRRLLVPSILAGVASASVVGPAQAQVPNLPGWDLVWHDEFDGTSLNTADWEALNRQDSFNNEKQYYLDDQVSVANGNLTLTATNQPIANKQYRSGLVRTWQEYTYGRWEIRANLPTTQGMWPAIWLLPRNEAWPSGGEIDIMENRGSQPYITSSAFHYGPDWQNHQYVWGEYSAFEGGQPVNFHESYHDYAVEWDANYIKFFVDGNLHFSTNSGQVPIPDGPMSLIINLAIGGDFGGDPNGSTVWPQTFDIDYVRYWEKSTTPPLQGDINQDGYVGIADLNVVLGEWNLGTPPGETPLGTQLTDFGNFSLAGTYEQWNNGILTATANDYRVQANDFGGGWYNFSPALDATGETTLQLRVDVNPGNVADAFNIVLIDADGTERVYHFGGLTEGEDQLLVLDLGDYQQDNAVGSTPGLDLANLVQFHMQGSFGNGNPGLPMDITFDNMSLGEGGALTLLGDVNGDGFVGIADLNIILGNWNQGTPPTAAVPEPAALTLLGLGTLALTRRRNARV